MMFLIVEPSPLPFSSLLGPNIRLRILFSNTLSLRSSLNVRDHVSQPYSTTVTAHYNHTRDLCHITCLSDVIIWWRMCPLRNSSSRIKQTSFQLTILLHSVFTSNNMQYNVWFQLSRELHQPTRLLARRDDVISITHRQVPLLNEIP